MSRLTGPRSRLDPRQNVIRADLVDVALADSIASARYVAPVSMRCAVPRTAMRGGGNAGAVAASELLFGEGFALFETVDGWSFGQRQGDGYIGWVAADAIVEGPAYPLPISARVAPVFCEPDIKAPLRLELPFGACVAGKPGERFLALDDGGFVHLRHLEPMAKSPIAVARHFAGAPYLWGGRTPLGVDCSGLVQAALAGCGIAAPRDSDQQLALVGTAVEPGDRAPGDLVFFPGHVGILTEDDQLFHANAHWMATVEEPLADVIARVVAAGTEVPVSGVRRLISPA